MTNSCPRMDKDQKFQEIIGQHQGILFKVARIYCQTDEDRKDLVQEILFQLWKSFDKYDSRFKYSTWIYRIALNVAISFYRKNSAKKEKSAAIEEAENVVVTTELDEGDTRLVLLEKFIGELKELDKALMMLYLADKSHQEIAEILGISASNVSTKIGRIKEKLKQKFAEQK